MPLRQRSSCARALVLLVLAGSTCVWAGPVEEPAPAVGAAGLKLPTGLGTPATTPGAGKVAAASAQQQASRTAALRQDPVKWANLPDGSRLMITPPTVPTPPAVSDGDFVTRRGTQLILQGQAWYFVGFNAYWLVDAGSWGKYTGGRERIAETLSASKRLGMRAVRTWGFNTHLPAGPNQYDEDQFEALDYVVYACRVYGLRLILALGNFWPAYKAPEDFIVYATGSTGNGVLDFYRNPAVRALYRSHITTMLTRVNKFTGIAYKDDPTIMGYDVLNEPRCPGCESADLQSLVVGWMDEMTRHTKSIAPRQMAALGTEGFFTRDTTTGLHLSNPGPGAECEGEDWPRIASLPAVDFSTLHVYERHLEDMPVPPTGRTYIGDPDWYSCNFACYINWMARYIKVHEEVSEGMIGKPLIVEEYGLTWWRKDVRDRKVLLAVMNRMLAASAASGGSLAGVMLWNGAHNSSDDQDGYNVFFDRWPSPGGLNMPALNPIPPIMPELASWITQSKAQQNSMSTQPAAAPPASTGGLAATTGTTRLEPQVVAADGAAAASPAAAAAGAAPGGRRRLSFQRGMGGGMGAAPRLSLSAVMSSDDDVFGRRKMLTRQGGGRKLTYQADQLDGFRRGWERGSCAHESSRNWRPPVAFVNGTLPADKWSTEAKRWMVAPNVEAWRAFAWPRQEVDMIVWGTQQVNKPGQV